MLNRRYGYEIFFSSSDVYDPNMYKISERFTGACRRYICSESAEDYSMSIHFLSKFDGVRLDF